MFKRFWTQLTGNSERKSIFVLFFLVIWHCQRLFRLNRCFTQAAALAYHTIFGVVPLAIVMLMVFQMFPAYKDMGEKVKQVIYEQMNLDKIAYTVDNEQAKPAVSNTAEKPDSEQDPNQITIASKINEITNQYLSNLSTGAITFIGGLLIIWAAIGLLTTIEKSFNTMWGVPKSRDILHRTINYWAIVTLGPLLMGLGIYLSTYPTINRVLELSMFHFVRPLFGFCLSVILIFFLYTFIPNASVKILPALLGAIFAAILWTAAKLGFGIYVTKLIPYQAVYGIMGLIPLAVFWVYVVWLIVLIGLQMTYTAQHIHALDKAERLAKLREEQASFIASDQTTIQIMREVMIAFEDKNKKPITPSEIADTTALPADFIERILETMTRAELLCKTTDPVVGYVPSTDGANITLADVSMAVEKASFQTQSPKLRQIIEQVRAELAKYNLKDIL